MYGSVAFGPPQFDQEPGLVNPIHMHPPKLGSGERFAKLKKSIAERGGVRDPGAVAAAIGRRKYGAKKMAALAHHSRMASHHAAQSEHHKGLAESHKAVAAHPATPPHMAAHHASAAAHHASVSTHHEHMSASHKEMAEHYGAQEKGHGTGM